MMPTNDKERKLLLLEQEKQQIEEELSERYNQLGREIYEVAERSICEIGRLVDRMVELRLETFSLKDAAPCPHCLTENPLESTYCRHCGKQLPQQKEDLL